MFAKWFIHWNFALSSPIHLAALYFMAHMKLTWTRQLMMQKGSEWWQRRFGKLPAISLCELLLLLLWWVVELATEWRSIVLELMEERRGSGVPKTRAGSANQRNNMPLLSKIVTQKEWTASLVIAISVSISDAQKIKKDRKSLFALNTAIIMSLIMMFHFLPAPVNLLRRISGPCLSGTYVSLMIQGPHCFEPCDT